MAVLRSPTLIRVFRPRVAFCERDLPRDEDAGLHAAPAALASRVSEPTTIGEVLTSRLSAVALTSGSAFGPEKIVVPGKRKPRTAVGDMGIVRSAEAGRKSR